MKNMLEKIEKGDILAASKRKKNEGYHYIIFYEGRDSHDFIGGMITHSNKGEKVLMAEKHFHSTDENDIPYKVQFESTFLAKAKLQKLESWEPFTLVGKLTEEGVEFLDATIGNLNIETWDDYLRRTELPKE